MSMSVTEVIAQWGVTEDSFDELAYLLGDSVVAFGVLVAHSDDDEPSSVDFDAAYKLGSQWWGSNLDCWDPEVADWMVEMDTAERAMGGAA